MKCASCIVLALCVATALAKPTEDTSPSHDTYEHNGVCNTKECTISGAFIAEAMNQSVEPCDDFYSYACGSFAKKNNYKLTWETVFDLRKNNLNEFMKTVLSSPVSEYEIKPETDLKNFYFACERRDEERVAVMNSLARQLDSLNLLPLVRHDWDELNFDLESVVAQMLRMGSSSLISVDAVPDDTTDFTSRVISIGHEGVVSDLVSTEKSYKNYLDSLLSSLLSDLNDDKYKLTVSDAEVNAAIVFEKKLAKAFAESHEPMIRMSVADLKQYSPDIDWQRFFDVLLEGSDVNVQDTTEVELDVECLYAIGNLLLSTEKRVVANFLGLSMLRSFAVDASAFGNYQTRHGHDHVHSHDLPLATFEGPEFYCLEKADLLMRYVTAREYVKNWQPSVEPLVKKANKVYELVKAVVLYDLEQSDVLEEWEKDTLIHRANSIKSEIGYEDWILNDQEMENYYSGIEVSKENHLENVWELNAFLLVKKFNNLYGPQLKEFSQFSSLIVHKPAEISKFAMTIPIGLLEAPYMYRSGSDTINVGSLGAVLASELLKKLMVLEREIFTGPKLSDTRQCFSELYERVDVDNTSVLLDLMTEHKALYVAHEVASQLRDEVLLPGVGVESHHQLLWLSYGREMCENEKPNPNFWFPRYEERVSAVVSNSPAFQEDFNCPSSATTCTLF